MRTCSLILLILFFWVAKCFGTTISEADQNILKTFWKYAATNRLSELPINERIPIIGNFFMGSPYKSNTLNVTKEELPVINLRELDCVTLVENVLALALLDQYNEKAKDQFIGNIVKLRYRDGEIVDYCSRLHYSTDWLYEMQKQHFLTDATAQAGGIEYPQNICFMSANYAKYPVLAKDKKLIAKIKAIETNMNKRTYYYIPKDGVESVSDKIVNGDVILITTSIKGLDTSHLGFAIKKDGKVYLLHASSLMKKVVLTEVPLSEYMQGIKSQTGIMIGRACQEKK